MQLQQPDPHQYRGRPHVEQHEVGAPGVGREGEHSGGAEAGTYGACTGASSGLPVAECNAWQDFYTAPGGSEWGQCGGAQRQSVPLPQLVVKWHRLLGRLLGPCFVPACRPAQDRPPAMSGSSEPIIHAPAGQAKFSIFMYCFLEK